MTKKPRVVFDCNVLLQAAAREKSVTARCLNLVEGGLVQLFVSREVLAEVEDVLNRPEIRARFSDLSDEIVLGNKIDKKCRFCGEVEPHVMFKKEAHVIPQLLGNRNVVSFFECDICNEQVFSSYESSLAEFVGPLRALAGVRGRNGPPVYKYSPTGLRIKSLNKIFEVHGRVGQNDFEFDEEGKTFTVKPVRNPYYPLRVYKSLAKIAYCLLNEAELDEFDAVRDLLMSDRHDEEFRDFPLITLFETFIPGGTYVTRPSATLFKRRLGLDGSSYPEKTLVVVFANMMYQVFLWSSHDAEVVTPNKPFFCIRCPAPTSLVDQHNPPVTYTTNLSSPDKKVGDKLSYTFSYEGIEKTEYSTSPAAE